MKSTGSAFAYTYALAMRPKKYAYAVNVSYESMIKVSMCQVDTCNSQEVEGLVGLGMRMD